MSYLTSSPIPVSAADITGANTGQRPDLINLAGAIFVTVDGKQYRVWRGRIVDEIVPLSGNITLRTTDDGLLFSASTALTITVPQDLVPKPTVAVIPPPSGDVSVAFTGTATGNGAGTTLTRARSSNPSGFVIMPYPEAGDGYGVNGS